MSEPTLAAAVAAVAAKLESWAGAGGTFAERSARAAADLTAALVVRGDGEPGATAERWGRLGEALGLSEFDRELVALAALAGADAGLASVLAELHPRREPAAWVGLAADVLLDGPHERWHLERAVLAGPLHAHGVLRLDRGPFAHRTLQLAPGLWETLHGYDGWPAGVAATGPSAAATPGLQSWIRDPSPAHAVAMLQHPSTTVVVTASDAGEGAGRGEAIVHAAGRRPCHLTGEFTDPQATALICTVRGDVPVLPPGAASAAVLAALLGPAVIVVEPGDVVDVGDRTLVTVTVGRQSVEERLSMWQVLLPGESDAARRLAAVHRVGGRRAAQAVADAVVAAGDGDGLGEPTEQLIARHVRERATTSLPGAARLVAPVAGWNDLVVPADQHHVLVSAVERCRSQVTVLHEWGLGRGRHGNAGVRMLFAGPPGTGKTLAAEVIARELGLDLLVVDLAALVSRWLGETEKNLAEVFDAAERTHAVLFFDEADAMFARRTDVGDAHDRWANLETSYLLDRLERYEGVAVLASNLRANIDPAFLRRLEFVVDFREPADDERALLWAAHLPTTAPLAADVDFDELAQLYLLSGGVIKNAALAAAFLAAGDGGAITQHHLVAAIRREYEKSGRSFPGVPRRLTHRPEHRRLSHNGV